MSVFFAGESATRELRVQTPQSVLLVTAAGEAGILRTWQWQRSVPDHCTMHHSSSHSYAPLAGHLPLLRNHWAAALHLLP
eukprot:scaffold336_cov250-Pinguiococcus_pyrenoidosus.AAC.41